MALESIAKLFSTREKFLLDDFDIQYGVEQFLQKELHSDKIHCKIKGASRGLDITVASPALAEAVYVREHNLRIHAFSQLQCSLGPIRVMLEI